MDRSIGATGVQGNYSRLLASCLLFNDLRFVIVMTNTYAEFHIGSTATKPGAAAQKTAQNKIDKYSKSASTHIIYPFAIETAGTWHEMAIELTQEIGRRITTITEDIRETTFLFQRLSVALQKRKCGFFPQHHGHRVNCRCSHNFLCLA